MSFFAMILLSVSFIFIAFCFHINVQEQAIYHVLLCLIVAALWNVRKLNERHYQTYLCVTNLLV